MAGLGNFTEEMLELLLFALKDLRNSLKDLGSDLMIRFGRTESVIQDLVKEVSATNIYTQEEVEYDLRLVIENVKENLFGENSPEISLWSTPLYDTKNMVDLPLSYDEFQRLNFNVHSPLSAPQLPGSPIDLARGPLPTLDDLKEFMDESPYKLSDTWSSIKSSSAEKVLQNARNLISNGVTSSQSNMNSLTTRIKEKRVKNSAFVTKLGIFVGGGTDNVLNALAAYLRYLEGTARDDWQEVHARLRDAETREGASFGTLFGPALQLGIVSRRRVYHETIKYEKERNGGFLSPFGYSAASVAAVADHVCSREYAVMGSEGPAVLLVHGFGAFLEHYRDNINEIVEGGNRVWAITLLGFGRSEKPNVVYTELMWAELLRDFIVDVVREPVHLVGNSFGGYFVSIVAGLWPDLVKSVVLLNSAGHYVPGYSSVPPSKERKTSGIAWLGARGLLFYLRLSLRNLVKRCYPTITERADEGLLNEMSDDPGALVVLESIFTFDPSIPLNYLFKGFENKVLIIQGMKDPISDSKTKVSVVKKHFKEIVIKELDAVIGGNFGPLTYKWVSLTGQVKNVLYNRSNINQIATFSISYLHLHCLNNLISGHCPHDEVPEEVNSIIREWVINTENRGEILKQSSRDESKVAA
ncbi:DNA photolyase, N-terminal [Artemisia annua]|uniref:DNA photolyase, N-terminal n=1 Tax=Artemisia annua TaxID=35608 RepID=A0A2U1KU33_ARTAN|nr:DNA photolyase, N-terminal [Artemisia annua]